MVFADPKHIGYWKRNDSHQIDAGQFARQELLPYCPKDRLDDACAGVVEQLHLLTGDHGEFRVRQNNEHRFPDGEIYYLPYFVFEKHGIVLGVTRLTHGKLRTLFNQKDPGINCIRIDLIQGNQWIDARKHGVQGSIRRIMLEHLIASTQPLLERGWTVALNRTQENLQIAKPYFPDYVPGIVEFDPYTETFFSVLPATPLGLDLDHRKVKRIFRRNSAQSNVEQMAD